MDDIQSWWEVPSIAHFCSLFRVAFNLLDFDIEELEEALLTDGTEDCGSSLLQELIVRLLCGCLGNNGISTFNYQMFLRRLFRQKCREYGKENPFNTDIDFQFLPLRTKVEILHALCDFRLDADDVLDVLKNLDSDSLRVHPLGYDENRSAYWYFYGTRLYREDYPKAKKKKKKAREREKQRGRRRRNRDVESSGSASEADERDMEKGVGVWQVVCYTESDWERLALKMEDSVCKEERALHTVLAEDFLPEIPRLFEEKERLQRKRLLEMQPRRQSSRIEKLKHQKEEKQEKMKQMREEKLEQQRLDRLERERQDDQDKRESAKSRAARAMLRSRSSSECGSSGGGSSTAMDPDKPKGRQTNNSLASATGQIIIQPSRQKLRTSQVFRQSEEDLQTGLYKILDRIKNHDDAWPFLGPVEEEYAPSYYSVIARPMDLQRMEDKLDSGEYMTFGEFKADFQLIIDNCRQYNGSDNEYTEMVGKLQEVFEAAADRYLETELSTDEEVAVEFPGERAGGRRRKGSANAKTSEPGSPSESAMHRSGESEGEGDPADLEGGNGRTAAKEGSTDGEVSQDSGDVLARKAARSKKNHHSSWPPKKAGANKNVNVTAIEALELATEQTLKDINKWLDDTPRFSEFSSASNSPSQAVTAEDCEIGPRIESEYRNRLKLERPQRPRDNRESQRRRMMKDQGLLKRRKEIHRTIDRLQPGKSKGNLLSNLSASKNGDETSITANKDLKSSVTDKLDMSAPKLSLGTVLTSDVIGFGKHSFGENDITRFRKDGADSMDDSNDDKRLTATIDDDKKLQEGDMRSDDNADAPSEKKVKKEDDALVVIDVNKKSDSGGTVAVKQEKSTPNLSAWFKAFGAPKSQQSSKKKVEPVTEESKAPLKIISEPIKLVKEEELLLDEEKEKRSSVVVAPPLQSPARRQRKASTGSSVSERSSFSQDPMDPSVDGNSPRPSLVDEPYLSPQSEPMKTPYHHSPINGTIRVGFYQDTSFPRSNSSSSPRDPPSCSPREPPSCSPRDLPNCSPRDLPNCSPRDLPNCSPRDLPNNSPREPVASPKPEYPSPYTPATIPKYSTPAVTASSSVGGPTSLYEAPLSPYPAHMPYYDTSKSLTEQYRSTQQQQQQLPPPQQPQPQPPVVHPVEKPVSVFPVKKRIYNDIENTQATKPAPDLSSTYRGGSFTPTKGAVEQERGFTPTPGRMPASTARHTYPAEAGLPLGLAHHALPPHPLMDPFAEERLLQTPFFSGESLYGKSAQVTSASIPLTMFSQTGNVTTTASYAKENAHSYPPRPELTEVNVSPNYNRPGVPLSYPDPRCVKGSENNTPSYGTMSLSKGKASPSTTALNYSRTSDIMAASNTGPSSPLNFSSSDIHLEKVTTSAPIPYLSRTQDLISSKPSGAPLGYGKPSASDLMSGKVSAPSPISFAGSRSVTDMLPNKVNSPYSGRSVVSDLSSGAMNYNGPSDLVSNKIAVPSPLAFASQQDILSGKVNYSHPMTELMQSQARYNYPMSELMQGKAYPPPMAELMQQQQQGKVGRGPGGYVHRPADLLPPNVYDYPVPVSRATAPQSKASEPVAKAAPPKKQSKKKKTAAAPVSAAEPSGFQQYSSAASEAIALKTASVVPGSAFNFGPAPPPPLKDGYASYIDEIRSSGYYVPPPHPDAGGGGGGKCTSPGPPHPHPPTSPFSFLGHSPSSRPPAYAHHHPFMNSPYQQYLQRHPEELLRPMVLTPQGLLPPAGYPPGYLSMHDHITRGPAWL